MIGGMIVKRLMTMILIMGMMVIMFVGCRADREGAVSDEKRETNISVEKDGEKEKVKLVVWGGVPAESGPQKLVDAWNEANPDVFVEYVRFVNDDTGNTKLDTGILSGEQIDIFFTYANHLLKQRVESGMVANLVEFGVNDFVEKEIVGSGEGIITFDNEYYALPTTKEIMGVMVNQDMMVEKGVTIPANWSFDEYKEVAKQLTDDGVYGTLTYYTGVPLNLAQYVIGGDVFYNEDGTASNFDSREFAISARMKELLDNGSAMPYEEQVSRNLNSYAHPAFLSEELALLPFADWMLRYVKDLDNFPHDFKVTFAPFPTTEKGVENLYYGQLNNYMCMNSSTKYKEEAWEFMKYWITEGSEYMLTAGKAPVWKQADPDVVTREILGENAEQLFNEETYRKLMLNPDIKFIVDTHTTAYAQIIQIWKEESEMYFLDAIDKETYLNNLKRRADEAIANEIN